MNVVQKMRMFWYALRGGISYPVFSHDVDEVTWKVWHTWNIPLGISGYGVASGNRMATSYDGKSITDAIQQAIERVERVLATYDTINTITPRSELEKTLNQLRQLLAFVQEK